MYNRHISDKIWFHSTFDYSSSFNKKASSTANRYGLNVWTKFSFFNIKYNFITCSNNIGAQIINIESNKNAYKYSVTLKGMQATLGLAVHVKLSEKIDVSLGSYYSKGILLYNENFILNPTPKYYKTNFKTMLLGVNYFF